MSFTFEFVLGSDVVKCIKLPTQNGVRELRSSGGQRIGRLVVREGKVRLELEEFAAKIVADAQFH